MELLQCVTEVMRVTAVVAQEQEAGRGEQSKGADGDILLLRERAPGSNSRTSFVKLSSMEAWIEDVPE